jgi:hypothetical protein
MLALVLLIASVLFMCLGLGIGLTSISLLNDRAPAYRLKTMGRWFSPRQLRTFFNGNGYRRLTIGGLLIGLGALTYLSTFLLR